MTSLDEIEDLTRWTLKKEIKMFGIGIPELAIILVIVLVIFGAGKLPGIGEGLGNGIRNFKKALNKSEDVPAQLKQDQPS